MQLFEYQDIIELSDRRKQMNYVVITSYVIDECVAFIIMMLCCKDEP